MTKKQAEAHLAKLARRREQYAAQKKKVAPTPREPVQLALALPEPRVLRPMTSEAQREIDLETRNLGRAWIAQILAGMEAD
jgi:hypothetical protein